MQTRIDHLVIGAQDLNQGVEYVKTVLGVDMPFGGVHTRMGTCNHLMQLGNETFLEIIAVNPEMTPPESPRWFGLDDPHIRQSLAREPALLTWVVNTGNMDALFTRAQFFFGSAQLIQRGDLSWYFGLTQDGSMHAAGMLPYVIEWQTDTHPSVNMADLDCRLKCLEIYHPNSAWLKSVLRSIHADTLVDVHPLPENSLPYLSAHIDTPMGTKVLRSAGC